MSVGYANIRKQKTEVSESNFDEMQGAVPLLWAEVTVQVIFYISSNSVF